MAAPKEVTIKNLSGKWVMSKTLSDDTDSLLSLQGIGWLTRKGINMATVVLSIKHTEKDGVATIHVTSEAALTKTEENRILDFADRDHHDKIFGLCNGRSRYATLSTVELQEKYSAGEEAFIRGKTEKDLKTPTQLESEDIIQSYVKNMDKGYGWTAEQIWGFETVRGERRYTRRVVVKNADGKKSVHARLVYDYQGPLTGGDDALAYGDNQ